MRRAEQLRAEFDTHVYIVMYCAGRYYTYMSDPRSLHWLPLASEIVSDSLDLCRHSLTLVPLIAQLFPPPSHGDAGKFHSNEQGHQPRPRQQ